MNLTISERDKNLLIGVLGILFAVVAWFFIASPIFKKTDELEIANVTLKQTADKYVEVNAKMDEYKKSITKLTEEKTTILNSYPADMSREDQIMFWINLENTFSGQLAFSSLSMSPWEELSAGAPAEAAPVPEETDLTTEEAEATDTAATPEQSTPVANLPELHLYRAPINFGYNATYVGLKGMIQYLFDQLDKKNIENLSVSFDSSTGNLSGTIDVNLFYLMGTDKPYTPKRVPDVMKGVSDVFHTVEGAGLTPNEQETENDGEEDGSTE